MRAAVLLEPDQPWNCVSCHPAHSGHRRPRPDRRLGGVPLRRDHPSPGHGGLGPVILGHEGCGTVLEVGGRSGTSPRRPGHRRVPPRLRHVLGVRPGPDPILRADHHRRHAGPLAGRRHRPAHVVDERTGTFAEEAVVDRISLVRVESGLPRAAGLVGCAAMTGVGAALNTARVEPGSVVVVLGCGGVGQFVVQGARIAGATRIIAVDPFATKRDRARGNGRPT